MNAKEAQKITKENFDRFAPRYFETFMNTIERTIEDTARRGENTIQIRREKIRSTFVDYCAKRLRQMGYYVSFEKYKGSENFDNMNISW